MRRARPSTPSSISGRTATAHRTPRAGVCASLVANRSSCLTTVDPRSLRLLSLRSGLHGKKRSQRTTARMLKVSLRREQLLEQIALLELRGQTGGACSLTRRATPSVRATRLTATAPWLKRSAV